jgi:hypothetical protein
MEFWESPLELFSVVTLIVNGCAEAGSVVIKKNKKIYEKNFTVFILAYYTVSK